MKTNAGRNRCLLIAPIVHHPGVPKVHQTAAITRRITTDLHVVMILLILLAVVVGEGGTGTNMVDVERQTHRGYNSRYRRGSRSRTRSPPPSRSRRDSYHHHQSERRRSSYSSTSPEYRRDRRNSRRRSHRSPSRSAEELPRKRGRHSDDRNRRYSTTSYTSTSVSSRSKSRSTSSDSRSRSRSPSSLHRRSNRHDDERSVSSEHESAGRRRRSPSSSASLHADEKKETHHDNKRDYSRERSSRHHLQGIDEEPRRRGTRDGETVKMASKRPRSHERDNEQRGTSPKASPGSQKQRTDDGDGFQVDPKQRETQLREQLLRDKIKRSRKNSNANEELHASD